MNQLHGGLSIQNIIKHFVDKDFRPAQPLLEWLEVCGIRHNGSLDADSESPSIVTASQDFFQRYLAPGIPKARTDIDLQIEDGAFAESDERRTRYLMSLNNLGLYYHNYATPDAHIDCLLWHTGYLPELIHQYHAMVTAWAEKGVRWSRLVFLGARKSVGTDPSAGLLKQLFCDSQRYQNSLRNLYNRRSLFWYVPRTELVQSVWYELPMPEEMRNVETIWTEAPDTMLDNGKVRLANTQDTLAEFLRECGIQAGMQYGLCTRAPTAPRQALITVNFLADHLSGFNLNNLPIICARHAGPVSPYIWGREAANVLWELAKISRKGGLGLW